MTETTATPSDQVRAILRSVDEDCLTLHLPHTSYEIRLHLAGAISAAPGTRVRGTVTARAMRVHAAGGGGRFIEPVSGEPRIVAGTVLAVDQAHGRVLIDVAMPMWIEVDEGQDWGVFEVGALVNGYVKGATFTPTGE